MVNLYALKDRKESKLRHGEGYNRTATQKEVSGSIFPGLAIPLYNGLYINTGKCLFLLVKDGQRYFDSM